MTVETSMSSAAGQWSYAVWSAITATAELFLCTV